MQGSRVACSTVTVCNTITTITVHHVNNNCISFCNSKKLSWNWIQHLLKFVIWFLPEIFENTFCMLYVFSHMNINAKVKESPTIHLMHVKGKRTRKNNIFCLWLWQNKSLLQMILFPEITVLPEKLPEERKLLEVWGKWKQWIKPRAFSCLDILQIPGLAKTSYKISWFHHSM